MSYSADFPDPARENNTVIGIDFGTNSVRCVLVDYSGSILNESVCDYPRWNRGLYSNAAENRFRQHPLDYLESLEIAVKNLLKGQDADAVSGISLDTTGSTPCAVDLHGTPLAMLPEFAENPNAMFILWKDHTGIKEAEQINSCAEHWQGNDYRKYIGGSYSCEWFWSKILHVLKTDEKVRHAAYSWVEHCDWMIGELTGNTDPLTMYRSRCAAGHKAMWHASWNGLPPEEFLTAVDPLLTGLRARLFESTGTVDTVTGKLSAKWAEKLGLPRHVVIAGCALDCHMGAVGAGIAPGTLLKVFGTSTCDIVVTPALQQSIPGICGEVDGSVLPGMTGMEAGQSAFGDIYDWFRRFLSYTAPLNLSELEKEAAALPVDACRVMALDWHNGRRSPDANPLLTGAVFNLTLGTTPAMFYRALAEATVFGSRRIMERFQQYQVPVERISAIGGISRKSPFIMQMCADIFKKPVSVIDCDQTCALGAAIAAAAASGLYPDLPTAIRQMHPRIQTVYEPDPTRGLLYEERYQEYLRLGAMWEKAIRET